MEDVAGIIVFVVCNISCSHVMYLLDFVTVIIAHGCISSGVATKLILQISAIQRSQLCNVFIFKI